MVTLGAALLLTLLGGACDPSLKDPGFDPAEKGVQMCGEPLVQDSYDILDPEPQIEGDTLTLNVGHSGGCEEHEFGLCWGGEFLESDPVQVNVVIPHNGNGDSCEAYVEAPLSFDLSELKADWQAAYKQESGTIQIHLEGWEKSIEYIF